jgi:hypothetical protein
LGEHIRTALEGEIRYIDRTNPQASESFQISAGYLELKAQVRSLVHLNPYFHLGIHLRDKEILSEQGEVIPVHPSALLDITPAPV